MVYYIYTSGEGATLVFEFDEAKSHANKRKHGMDFVEARSIWLDTERTEGEAGSSTEARFFVTGLVDGRHWTAVITYRGDRIRLISVRRARKGEIDVYEA